MGSSRVWDADTDLIRITDTSVLQNVFDGGGTVSAWVYYTSSISLARIVSKVAVDAGWIFWMNNLQFSFFYYFSGTNLSYKTANLSLNTWYYLTVTYNSNNVANVPIMYVNAVVTGATTATAGTGTYDTDVGQDLVIGNTTGVTGGFRGNICYVQLWDKILTIDEVSESMVKPGSVRTNLVGYWPVLGSDSPERDLSGNGNTGAVTSADSSDLGPKVTSF